MKLLNHIYAIKNILSQGPAPDDASFSNALIVHFLQISRSKLLENKIDKYHFISEQSYQDLCLELEQSTFASCCEVPDVDCYILKSAIQLPKFLNSRWGAHLKVMDMLGNVIPELRLTQSKYSKYSPIDISNQTGWFVHNNYLYIIHNTHLKHIIINGLFDDPESVAATNCSQDNGPCSDAYEAEFPIDSDLVDNMYKMTLEYLLRSRTIPKDLENDAKEVQANISK